MGYVMEALDIISHMAPLGYLMSCDDVVGLLV